MSGHYRPTVEVGKNYPQLLRDAGLDTSSARLSLYGFEIDPITGLSTNQTLVIHEKIME